MIINPKETAPAMLESHQIDQYYLRWRGRMRKTTNLQTGTESVEINKKWKRIGHAGNLEWECTLPKFLCIDKIVFWIIATFLQDPTTVSMKKVRTVYPWIGKKIIEVDEYEDHRAILLKGHECDDVLRLEVEVEKEYDLASVAGNLPKYFTVLEDVTGDPYWNNANMSRRLKEIGPR